VTPRPSGGGQPARKTIRSLEPVIQDSHACTPAADSQPGPCAAVITSASPSSAATCAADAGTRRPLNGANGRTPRHQPAANTTPAVYRSAGERSSKSRDPAAITRSSSPDTTRQACSTSAGDRCHNPSDRPYKGPLAGTADITGVDAGRADSPPGTALNSTGAITHPRPLARHDPTTVRTPTDIGRSSCIGARP
jgi:hypothetical protein